jgi:hypothetical protein
MPIDSTQYFDWLTDMRDSGYMNMAGAPRELRNEFGLNRDDATRVFYDWVESLSNGGDE